MQVSNPEPTAEDFAAERDRDGIPYFRFNPADIHVGTTEVKAIKLVDMMIKTRQYLNQPEQIKKWNVSSLEWTILFRSKIYTTVAWNALSSMLFSVL